MKLATASRLLALIIALTLSSHAWGETKYKILHGFTGRDGDGGGLWGSLAVDAQGNVYGATSGGGVYGYGTVFELTPEADNTWTETILHSFQQYDPGGNDPVGGVVIDSAGNIYGTAEKAGAYGYGTIFELSRENGDWVEEPLFSFDFTDGASPYAGPTMDGAGNLYGTAEVVYELTPGIGGWTEQVLHSFDWSQGDGYGPIAGVVLDRAGNLYGATEYGGTYSGGIVYELKHTRMGWKEYILHTFGSFQYDGLGPGIGALAFDNSGNLYGTTASGGTNICFGGCGTIFELTPEPNGHWKETILYNFEKGAQGFSPGAGVVVDEAGNLYGTTLYGGSRQCGCGVVYKLARTSPVDGQWTYTVLHTFYGPDGAQPDANLILDGQGHLYGTTAVGGPGGAGVVYEIIP